MKILTVCLGNICRSPLAQGILEKVIREHGLDWQVDSAGTSGWHIGETPDPRSINIAHKHGIDISTQRARHFSADDFFHYDYILAMDRSNLKDILSKAPRPELKDKVFLILSFDKDSHFTEVPDPYYDNSFQRSYDLLYGACKAFVEQIAPTT